jgi:uncharacterized membrane protein YqjE
MALANSLLRLANTSLGILRSRLELASIDLEDELRCAISILLAGSAAVMLASFALLFGAFALAALYWETHRILALSSAGGVFALIAAIIAIGAWRFLNNRPRFMSATLAELDKDREQIGSQA